MFPIISSVQQCFTSPITNMIVHDPVSFFSCQSLNPDKCLIDIEITEQIIIDSIQELSSTSAAGPDGGPCCCLLTPMTLAGGGGVRCSRLWSNSQLLRPSGQ